MEKDRSNVRPSTSSLTLQFLLEKPIGYTFTSRSLIEEGGFTSAQEGGVTGLINKLLAKGLLSAKRSTSAKIYTYTIEEPLTTYRAKRVPGAGSVKGRQVNKIARLIPPPHESPKEEALNQGSEEQQELDPSRLLEEAKAKLLVDIEAYEKALYTFALACAPTMDLLQELARRESNKNRK